MLIMPFRGTIVSASSCELLSIGPQCGLMVLGNYVAYSHESQIFTVKPFQETLANITAIVHYMPTGRGSNRCCPLLFRLLQNPFNIITRTSMYPSSFFVYYRKISISRMFPGTYVPRYRCSPNLCSPVPMFPGIYVPRYRCSPVFVL